MPDAGWDLNSTVGIQDRDRSGNLYRQLPAENKEKLSRYRMVVPYLLRTGRHSLMNNAHILTVYQPPAITVISPAVVLRTIF